MHLPGYFSLRDRNNNTGNTNWTLMHCQDRNSGQHNDLFTARSTGDFDVRKDQLRRTMLKHETVFQHQLHELHRLYNAQQHMMNEIVRIEKRPEASLGGFTSCLSSEDRRSEWQCPVSNSVQSLAKFKIGESFDGSNCDRTRRRLYDVDVAEHLVRYDGVVEVPADNRKHGAFYHCNFTGDGCGAHLRSMRNEHMIDLNESFPDDEPSPQRQNMLMGTSSMTSSIGGSFPGHNGPKGSAFPGISSDNTTQGYKSPHSEHGKRLSNSTESCEKKKIFGVDISENTPSKNGCFKLLGFTVLENQQEPQDLHSFTSSTSKSSSPASVLFSGANSRVAKPLNTDHMLMKPEEKQLFNSFSSSPASVLSYSGNSGNAESLKTDHVFPKPASVTGFSGSKFVIDLNSCAEESEEAEEVWLEPSSPRDLSTRIEIDLEAPACPDPESSGSEGKSSGNGSLNQRDDATVVAAEGLLSISSSPVNDSRTNLDPLGWLIDVISSQEFGSASSSKDTAFFDDSIPKEMDYFEYMTLKLPETGMEEPEDISRVCKNPRAQSIDRKLPQRGQTRRGRRGQRKDFQRDVLPSLASLSRNEAVDDLHVIGDLIRDIDGYTESGWTRLGKTGSGSTDMKPGSGRGRKRSVNGVVERSLVEWGKRTRRPPRQRCLTNAIAHPVIARQ